MWLDIKSHDTTVFKRKIYLENGVIRRDNEFVEN